MRIRHTALLAGLFCLTTAGCTTASQGEPIPVTTGEHGTTTSSPPVTGGDDLPSDGAPKVETPLDTTRYEQDPCASLTAAQAQELNLPTTGKKDGIPYGVGCEWLNTDTRGDVSIGLLTGNDRGLSAFYAANQRDPGAYFTPLPDIEGYPAVARDGEDRRPRGICVVDVGVSDQLVIDVYLRLSQANVGQKDPCAVATQVAGMALRTMKAGA